MIIKPNSEYYFTFQLSSEEKGYPETAELIRMIKRDIPHKWRLYFREEKRWAIHHDYFDIFMALVTEFYAAVILRQGKLFE